MKTSLVDLILTGGSLIYIDDPNVALFSNINFFLIYYFCK